MTTPPRPTAVTLACVFVGVSCALLLGNIVTLLGDWGSIEVQEQLSRVLDEEPLSGSGITMTQALSWLRIALLVGVALAVAGIVFSVYTARGHRPSRIYLTVLCVLGSVLFLGAGLAGLLPAAVALACAFTLWSADARRWFDAKGGRTPVELGGRPDPFADRSADMSATSHAAPRVTTPHAAASPGTTTAVDRRPRAVALGAGFALALSVLAAAMGALALLLSTVGESAYRRSIEDSGTVRDMMQMAGVSVDDMLSLMTLAGAGWLLMGVVGAVAAVATLAGSNPGRLLLRIMSVLTVGVSMLFLPLGLLTGAAAVLSLVQMQRPEARAWFATQS